jgi:hypothetical protein
MLLFPAATVAGMVGNRFGRYKLMIGEGRGLNPSLDRDGIPGSAAEGAKNFDSLRVWSTCWELT